MACWCGKAAEKSHKNICTNYETMWSFRLIWFFFLCILYGWKIKVHTQHESVIASSIGLSYHVIWHIRTSTHIHNHMLTYFLALRSRKGLFVQIEILSKNYRVAAVCLSALSISILNVRMIWKWFRSPIPPLFNIFSFHSHSLSLYSLLSLFHRHIPFNSTSRLFVPFTIHAVWGEDLKSRV